MSVKLFYCQLRALSLGAMSHDFVYKLITLLQKNFRNIPNSAFLNVLAKHSYQTRRRMICGNCWSIIWPPIMIGHTQDYALEAYNSVTAKYAKLRQSPLNPLSEHCYQS